MRRLFTLCYFASWALTTAALGLAVVSLTWSIARVSTRAGIDDDLTLLALPLGAVLGVWLGFRARYAKLVHRAIGAAGVTIAVAGGFAAKWFLQRSTGAAGAGPAAGLGELVAAGASAGVVLAGVGMIAIWGFARMARLAEPVSPGIADRRP